MSGTTRDPKPPPVGDGWYESEEPTRLGLTFELRRIALRFRVRPLPVLLLAVIVTAGIAYKFLKKPKVYEARVVLALTEGTEFSGKSGIPFDSLRAYVLSSLMPDAKLQKLIEDRSPRRKRSTPESHATIDELREQIEVEIWKNTFVFYEEEDYRKRKSARIGITFTDSNPDRAMTLVRDIASIVIETHDEQRQHVARSLASQIEMSRQLLSKKLSDLAMARSVKQTALAAATKEGDTGLAAELYTELAAMAHDEKGAEDQLGQIIKSPDTIADQLTAAGLGMRIDLVEERRPDRPEQSWLSLVLTLVVVGASTLIGSALFLGTFDARVHDTDDVARLGLPVLGHVPGFPGDRVGSLRSRGARRARVPWFLRWRSRP